ncbi:MAG: hypothetical protein RIR51_1291, partial [Bacteroidota bacterium]
MKYLLSFLFISIGFFSLGQGIAYQAMILDPDNQIPGRNSELFPYGNKEICLEFSIINESEIIEYRETQNTKTSDYGRVDLIIGEGQSSDNFSSILWDGKDKKIVTKINYQGECNLFEVFSESKFTYVPYAYYSLKSNSSIEAGTGVSISPSQVISIGQAVGTSDNVQFNSISGNLTGNVTGNVTGDVTGNLTGDVTGNVSGTATNVTGTVAIANGGTGATNIADARTNLGANTVGSNIFTLTNPNAESFLKIKADNSIETLDAANFRSALGLDNLTLNIPDASASSRGALTAADWTSFNSKQNQLTAGTGISLSGNILSIGQAVGTTDNVQFNSITGNLTGDVTGDVTGNVTGTATNVTGTVAIANGGTGATNIADARTNLGANTVGSNIFTLTNPNAESFLKIKADNSIETLDAANFRSAIGAGTSSTSGTVTSVGLNTGTTGTDINITGGPITSSGNLTLNIPDASASTRGALTAADWTSFNSKQNQL